jgi:serine/threonine-protein kinase
MKTCTTCGADWPDDTRFCPTDGTTLRSASGGGDLLGSVIADRYHIEKKLGEGGMGAVYLGEHVKMGRKSAIKVMTQSMANDPEAIARFNREAANAARINHPNVCAIYDFGETDDGVIYLAMEFIEGESLNDTLHREGALAPKRAADILRQTADALHVAHEFGIVHRDLKPDNIMLARGRGDTDLVKVVDFGIAKAMTGEEGQKVTKTGLVVGTPEYMSPEQLSGDTLDGRSDLYSLALVFYRMLTGTLPFHADTAQETMIKRLTDDPMPLAQAAPGTVFPPALQEAMNKGLARMPSERYADASSFAADVVAAVDKMGDAPPRPSMTEARTQVLDAGATELLPETRVSKAAMQRPEDTPATPAPRAAPPKPARKAPLAAIAGAVVVIAGGGGALAMLLSGGEEAATPGNDSANVSQPAVQEPGTTTTPEQGMPAPGQDDTQQPRTEDPPATTALDPPAGDPAADPGGTAATPVLDLGVIIADIQEFSRSVDDDVATAEDRVRIEEIFSNTAVPDSVRAQAAFQIGGWHFLIDGNTLEACRWYRRALDREPGNSTFRNLYDTASCGDQ